MTPDEKREYKRQWYRANRERIRRREQEYYQAHGAEKREYARQWRQANVEKHRENARRYQKANPEKRKQIEQRYRQTEKYRQTKTAWKHGRKIQDVLPAMRDEQNSRCYLCGESLNFDLWHEVHLDHDHDCCPTGKSCAYCRRGLACRRCNTLIGHVNDDPGLLRKIADNLETALQATRERLAAKSVQGGLFERP